MLLFLLTSWFLFGQCVQTGLTQAGFKKENKTAGPTPALFLSWVVGGWQQ
jgi:hypothetical protein